MSTQIKVEAVTKEPRIWQGKTTWGVKLPGDGGWITLYKEQRPNKGDTLDVNITERNVKGRVYVDAFPVMPPLVQLANQPAQQNGAEPTKKEDDTWSNNTGKKVSWDDTRELIKAAHNLALVLEPDELFAQGEPGEVAVRTDRSKARVALVNTVVIAYASGKISVPKEDDDAYVPPEDDDIPPF